MSTKEHLMRRLLALVLPAALLLGAPVAAAKEVSGAKVCGADGCRSIPRADETLLLGGDPAAGPRVAEPFVKLEMRIGAGGHSELVEMSFLPRAGLVLYDDGFTWMRPVALAEMRAQAGRVTPVAPSELPASALAAPPTEPAPAPGASGGFDEAWLLLPAAGLALAAAVALARRRRHGATTRVVGAAG
jgi:hypothetical protein